MWGGSIVHFASGQFSLAITVQYASTIETSMMILDLSTDKYVKM